MSEISHCYYNAPTFIHINYNKSVKIRFCHRIVVAVPVSVSEAPAFPKRMFEARR